MQLNEHSLSLVNHARIGYDYENHSRSNTRGLIKCIETDISNNYFKECKNPLADGSEIHY
jgi:hypothetical protein